MKLETNKVLVIKENTKCILSDEGEFLLNEELNIFGDHVEIVKNRSDILEQVYMPDTVIKIGFKAFTHCHKLKSVRFSNRLEEIELSAFLGCNELKEISLPNSVKCLREWCFSLIDELVIKYDGTIDEFNKIIKAKEWCSGGTKIICKDGELVLNDTK